MEIQEMLTQMRGQRMTIKTVKHADGLPDSLIPLSFSGKERKQSQPATVK